jgi:hypothetical protein
VRPWKRIDFAYFGEVFLDAFVIFDYVLYQLTRRLVLVLVLTFDEDVAHVVEALVLVLSPP